MIFHSLLSFLIFIDFGSLDNIWEKSSLQNNTQRVLPDRQDQDYQLLQLKRIKGVYSLASSARFLQHGGKSGGRKLYELEER